MEGSRLMRSRRNGRSNETLVSARQREGGSLPSNVNVDDIDSIVYSNYSSRQVSEANTEESSTYVPVLFNFVFNFLASNVSYFGGHYSSVLIMF